MEKIHLRETNMYDLSMCLAAIRPYFWKRFYDSANISCARHSFEVVIVSPFDLPEELRNIKNIKHFKDYGCPTRASQIAAANSEGRLMSFPCDDGVCLADAYDLAIDLYDQSAAAKDGIVMRYRESSGMQGPTLPDNYWLARTHLNVNSLNIGYNWKIACQPMLSLDYYKNIGGVDCVSFECMAFATHDLCYRMQRDGSVFHLSPTDVMNADNYGETGVDHAPVFYGQTQCDNPAFLRMYSDTKVKNRINIDFDNWKHTPDLWIRRWANGRME